MRKHKTRKHPKIVRLGEFFSGPGGFALGAKMAALGKPINLKHSWAVEADANSCQTYIQNILKGKSSVKRPDKIVINQRVENISIKSLSGIDIFAFGFPCNDFSQVGERKGTDGKFGPLYEWGAKVLDSKKPKVFVAENVGGIRSANDGKAFDAILSRLATAGPGYTLYVHFYKFEEYNVPQNRHRVVIVGVRNSMVSTGISYQVPAPYSAKKMVTAQQALKDIKCGDPSLPNNEEPRFTDEVRRRLSYIKPGENAWNSTISEPELRLNVKGAKLSNIYRRLRPDRPSYTVTGSGGGGTHIYHWKEDRPLSNRERAALQSFPLSYRFSGGLTSVRKQIGMAVPPRGACSIFSSIFKTVFLRKRLRSSVAPNMGIRGPDRSSKP
jgi:DNA (cytosine-5)-methyltransferase 1